jgi:AAA domain
MRSDRCRPPRVRGANDNAGRMTVVELVGTPGAGKTTLAVEIVELLRGEGVEAATIIDAARRHTERTRVGRMLVSGTPRRWRRPVLWLLFYVLGLCNAVAFVREQPRLSVHVLESLRHSHMRLARRIHVAFWFFQLGGRRRLLLTTARDREVLVVDDGFLHRSVHIFASEGEDPSVTEIAAYVDLLRAPQLVVRAVAERETCEERVRRRGVWRHSRNMTAGELSRYLANSDRAVGLAVRCARERGWIVAEVDNDDRSPADARPDLLWALRAGSVLPSAPRLVQTGAVS